MLNSVRIRLTAWYVAVLSLVLIGFSVGVYSLLARAAHSDVDHELGNAIDVLSRSLRHEIAEHEGKQAGEESFITQVLSTVYRDSFPSIAIAVYDGDRLVGSKPGPQGRVPHRQAESRPTLLFHNVQREEVPWRTATQIIAAEGAGDYQFVATSSLAPVEAELAELRGTFFLAVPLALAGAALGGFLLARKSLAPVVAMSYTADRISSKDLSQRIKVQNPRDELGKLGGTLNQLLSRIEQSFEQQKRFMADSSHELRTPIYVAHTAAQVMLEHEGRTEQDYREALATIDQQLKRLQHIVEDMFVLARADTGAYPRHIEDFDLGETIDESVRAARLLALRRGITVTGPGLMELPCRGDERLIRRLVMILLDNAVKYTPDGGRVSLQIDCAKRDVYSLTVADTGPGIPSELQSQIFDRFFRVDNARTASGSGAGLGLAIAKWIADVHGGKLALTNSGPEGSEFAVSILRSADDSSA